MNDDTPSYEQSGVAHTVALATTIALAFFMASARDVSAEDVGFSRDVRPILAEHCLKCHGPDEESRQSGLRLDVRESAITAADSGTVAIVPEEPADSELLRRVSATGDERMPPLDAKRALTAAEIAMLEQWIADGAKYEQHWAFVAPQSPSVPALPNSDWPRNAIDNFVLEKLAEVGVAPAPEADRLTLVRRVYLDLIGIPPSVEEANHFLQDDDPQAYERLVDRLLASPHYGERWARPWLDLARYADTNGYEQDRPRVIWPYRDWVIKALNDDMPFDQFTTEQLAGDLLPNATIEQRVATGFHRNTMLNEEGGINPLEFRYHAVVDRVNTTATTWLGLTMGCAQCHTHKYDPITQREYYELMAFFNNADEPDLDLPDPAIDAQRATIEDQIRTLEEALPGKWPLPADSHLEEAAKDAARRQLAEEAFSTWLVEQYANPINWQTVEPCDLRANLATLQLLPDGSILASGDQTKRDEYTLTIPKDVGRITAIRLEAIPDDSLPGHGPGRTYYAGAKGEFFLSELSLTAGEKRYAFANASESYAATPDDATNADFTAAMAIDGMPQTGWRIAEHRVDAEQAVFRCAEPVESGDTLELKLLFERYYAAALGRFRVSVTSDDVSQGVKPLPAEIAELLVIVPQDLSGEQRNELRRFFLLHAPELAEAQKEIDSLKRQMPSFPTTMVMQERAPGRQRATFVHHRGEFQQTKAQVSPGVPAALNAPLQIVDGAVPTRLTFARWLFEPENPLVARVAVNRQWATLFGKGIVRSTDNFGFLGDTPSHPALLDWLSCEFERNGWSMKSMVRLMVTSATYRQSSAASDQSLAVDPDNRILSRGARFRLEAEIIRDQSLAVSGLLSRKIGGPSVFPPQPPGVTTEGAFGALPWTVSLGEDRYRRGLYTYCKRSAPYAMFVAFDGPSGEFCLPRRELSNSPLQALMLLNDEVYVETSQAMGRVMASQAGSVDERIRALFRRCLIHSPTQHQVELLTHFYESQLGRFVSGELEAATVAGPGESDPNERAAWTVTARALLNSDQMITKE